MTQPRGLQRTRLPGWRKPPGAVIVDRTSRWGNPFTVDEIMAAGAAATKAEARGIAVQRYRAWLDGEGPETHSIGRRVVERQVLDHLVDLADDLCCTCPVDGEPCHRDELIARAAHEAAFAGKTAS